MSFLSIVIFTNCTEENDSKLEVPSTYSFTREGVSTVSFGGQTTRLAMGSEVASAMMDNTLSAESILNMYAHEEGANNFSDATLNSSDKNLRSKTAASADFFSANTSDAAAHKQYFEDWITNQTSEVFTNWEVSAAAGTAGQIADGSSVRYVSAEGIEYNQLFAKGLIGALIIDQILNNYTSTAVLDAGNNIADNNAGLVAEGKSYTTMEHKWDEAFGYLYGAEENPASPVLGADDFLNKYLARVDGDEDFAGIADEIFDAFVTGRAAIVAGDYDLRDDQVQILRENISLIPAIRTVYYLQAGKNAIEAQDFGGAFNDLSEGLGFLYSLQFTRMPNSASPYFTKAEVEGYIDQILAGENGLWNVSGTVLDNISADVSAKFGFTVAEAAE